MAEELSGQVEGDMLIETDEWSAFNGRLEESLRWTNNTVPYWINESLFSKHAKTSAFRVKNNSRNVTDQDQINYIHMAAAYLESQTCLKFPNRTTERDYVFITGDSVGCAAVVGRRGGAQRLRLQPHSIETGCFRFFTIVHEFMHALGFHHMQNTFDRDNYIRINWENVRPESVDSFSLRPDSEVSHFNVPYDIGSVMHYSQTAFSSNGRETMTPLFNPKGETMGQRIRLTPGDIRRINRMYNCPE